jgi:hypothetical protein
MIEALLEPLKFIPPKHPPVEPTWYGGPRKPPFIYSFELCVV